MNKQENKYKSKKISVIITLKKIYKGRKLLKSNFTEPKRFLMKRVACTRKPFLLFRTL
jgi:hypothetical protein